MSKGAALGRKDLSKGTGVGPTQDTVLKDRQEGQQEGMRPHAAPACSATCQAPVPGTQERLLAATALKGGCRSERQGRARKGEELGWPLDRFPHWFDSNSRFLLSDSWLETLGAWNVS